MGGEIGLFCLLHLSWLLGLVLGTYRVKFRSFIIWIVDILQVVKFISNSAHLALQLLALFVAITLNHDP